MNKYIYKYYRISLDDENTVESNSITNQRQIVEDYLATMPELANMPSVEIIDDGHTGTNFNRRGVQQLFKAVRRGEVSCIIVKDLSRFGRKYLEVSKYLEQLFPYLDVRFIAVGDGYDSDTHKGTTANLDVPIRNMLNALYSKKVSKDVKSAKQSQLQQGKYIHAFAPFGYKKDPMDKHRLVIDEPAAKVVRRIFELSCNGKAPKQIADILNSENIPTPSGYKKKSSSKLRMGNRGSSIWLNTTVNYILRNEQYTGTLIGGKTEIVELGTCKQIHKPKDKWIMIPNACPAIITQEIWDASVAQRTKYGGKRRSLDASRILYKRVRCGHCGHVLRYRTSSSRNYYTCRTPNYTDKYGCPSTQYYEGEIINSVKTVFKLHMDIMIDLERLSTTLKHASKRNISSVQSAIDRITGEIEQLQSSKRLLYERYKKGSIDKATYFKERETVENKINDKTLESEALTICNDGRDEALSKAHFFFDSLTQFLIEDAPNAGVINNLVESVLILGKDRMKVSFSFANKLEKDLHVSN